MGTRCKPKLTPPLETPKHACPNCLELLTARERRQLGIRGAPCPKCGTPIRPNESGGNLLSIVPLAALVGLEWVGPSHTLVRTVLRLLVVVGVFVVYRYHSLLARVELVNRDTPDQTRALRQVFKRMVFVVLGFGLLGYAMGWSDSQWLAGTVGLFMVVAIANWLVFRSPA